MGKKILKLNLSTELDILSKDNRTITDLKPLKVDPEKLLLWTIIPRDIFGSPISFQNDVEYSIVQNNSDEIVFFDARFLGFEDVNGIAFCKFQAYNIFITKNVRKEERQGVEFEAVITDYDSVEIVTVLDLSKSGMRLEAPRKLTSTFIEIYYDDSNNPKRETGRIVWEKPVDDTDLFLYGIEFSLGL